MTEHPIIFSSEMVRAILEGRKTQTRRVMKPQPEIYFGMGWTENGYNGSEWTWKELDFEDAVCACPYGRPDDRLWVRETIGYINGAAGISKIPLFGLRYLATNTTKIATPAEIGDKWRKYTDGELHKIPAIFMPRWASRITLEITSVRVERVQDISEDDIKAEGISPHTLARGVLSDSPPDARWKFIELWDSINSKRGYSWASNPWVWAISFTASNPQINHSLLSL